MLGLSGRKSLLQITLVATCYLWAASLVFAHDLTVENETPKARLSSLEQNAVGTKKKVRLEPVFLDGGSELSVIAPSGWVSQAQRIVTSLTKTHDHLQNLFGEIPKFRTSIQLMEEETFFLATGAPRWTNAMYYKGQIVIPLSESSLSDTDNLERSIRHEYTHAVIHALTDGNCPGWLDEGLAQWAEGSVNPALYKALSRWLNENPPLPHAMLQGGFTKLNPKMVPAAYAQSLVSTSAIISNYGFVKLRRLFDEFRKGSDQHLAFERAFGANHLSMEKNLACTLTNPECIQNPLHSTCRRCLSSISRNS